MGIFIAQVVVFLCALFFRDYVKGFVQGAFGGEENHRFPQAAITALSLVATVAIGYSLLGVPIALLNFLLAWASVTALDYFWR